MRERVPRECRCRIHPGIFPGEPHAVRLQPGVPLLGNLQQFCAAFYHIEPTPEAGLDELCLASRHGTTCPRKTVACIARLQKRVDCATTGSDGWSDVYTCRYVNCWRGDSRSNVHAEKFLSEDKAMAKAVSAMPAQGGRLILYLTYQPCHNSGGHSRSTMGHTTSCTNLLLAYAAEVLAPHAVSLHIRVPYIYRAHWKRGLFPPKYEPVVLAAIEGLQLLSASRHVHISALHNEDWVFLANLCEPSVRDDFLRSCTNISAREDERAVDHDSDAPQSTSAFHSVVKQQRTQLDAFIAATLQQICGESPTHKVSLDEAELVREEPISAAVDAACAECDAVPGADSACEHDSLDHEARIRWCSLCDVELPSDLFVETHLKGKRHLKMAAASSPSAVLSCVKWRVDHLAMPKDMPMHLVQPVPVVREGTDHAPLHQQSLPSSQSQSTKVAFTLNPFAQPFVPSPRLSF